MHQKVETADRFSSAASVSGRVAVTAKMIQCRHGGEYTTSAPHTILHFACFFRSAEADYFARSPATPPIVFKPGNSIVNSIWFPLVRLLCYTGRATMRSAPRRRCAIDNTQLFEAEQESKRKLQSSLECQTATADVLNIISRSPSELQPVLDTIVKTAAHICMAQLADIAIVDDTHSRIQVSFGRSVDREVRW